VTPLAAAELLSLAVDPATGTLLYQAPDLVRMEALLLHYCDWRVRAPSALSFLQNFLAAAAAAAATGSAAAPCFCGSSSSCVSCCCTGMSCGGGSGGGSREGDAAGAWDAALAEAAYRLLDVSLLQQLPLAFGPSTTALACLLLAEQQLLLLPAAPKTAAQAATAATGAAATAVQFVSGVSLAHLAPGLFECMELLSRRQQHSWN
ncbi:hypothetical protein Agub_g3849, partial [Astrephomene gubernaculifera]